MVVVGYIDESMIVYTIRSWVNEDINLNNKLSINKSQGQLLLDGQSAYDVNFGPPHIASMSLAYIHNGEYEPTIERIPLSITIPSLINSRLRLKREQNTTINNDYFNDNNNNNNKLYQKYGSGKHRRKHKRIANSLPVLQLELSIRIVRLYNHGHCHWDIVWHAAIANINEFDCRVSGLGQLWSAHAMHN
ncbi:unnamed protein product [Schistosoma margrebowiei]|uniref:Uncharacterized protein n=1 Tax=Schistosoma margrebowiei TaxID=48269 RepID=A0A183N5M0_9TREM|nr:unnamed protein product [Schistosoma margrebowiei]